MHAIVKYFKESFHELNKVSWPTKNQAVRITAIVLGFSLVIAAMLGILDYLWELGRNYLMNNVSFNG